MNTPAKIELSVGVGVKPIGLYTRFGDLKSLTIELGEHLNCSSEII